MDSNGIDFSNFAGGDGLSALSLSDQDSLADGGFNSVSYTDGAGLDGSDAYTGMNGNADVGGMDPSTYYSPDAYDAGSDTGTMMGLDSGAYDSSGFDPSQFGVDGTGADTNVFDPSVGMDPEYNYAGDPSDTQIAFDSSDATACLDADEPSMQDSDYRDDADIPYPDYSSPQHDQCD
ncbi:hypothetical protein ACEPAF_7024 [Sanghuangporus sanghuang]